MCSEIRDDVLVTLVLLIGLVLLAAGCARLRERTTLLPTSSFSSGAATTVLPPPVLLPTVTATKTAVSSTANTMNLIEVRNARARGAVCNDGSSARYYFRRGSSTQSYLWVIHLQGGGMCYNQETCSSRKSELPELMTSNNKPVSRLGNGIESASIEFNPDFAAANHVYIIYCSSDLWSGDRGAANATGLQFRGASIFVAVIDDLTNPSVTAAPNLSDARQVLFTGSSAGGVGVLVHLDWLVQRLPKATVRGVTDAGWFVDLQPYDTNIDSLVTQTQFGYKIWKAALDASCIAANRGTESRCYFGRYVYPYLTSPLFVQIAQSDGPQLLQLGLTLPLDKDKEIYISTFGEAVRASLQPVRAAFSPATTTHGLLTSEEFWTVRINHLSFREVLGNWFFERSALTKLIEK